MRTGGKLIPDIPQEVIDSVICSKQKSEVDSKHDIIVSKFTVPHHKKVKLILNIILLQKLLTISIELLGQKKVL